MPPREILQGFDVREMWSAFPASWRETRQQTFLLRRDLTKPLSTNEMVWESIFSLYGDDGNPVINTQGIEWMYRWCKLDVAISLVDQSWGANWRPCWIIAVTAVAESVAQEKAMHLNFCEGWGSPAEVDPQWQFLGYDISDGGGDISGLSNCGYTPDEQTALAAEWGPRLNQYHLFDDLSHALVFKTLSNARVPEHAPFAVFGLYLIESRGFA